MKYLKLLFIITTISLPSVGLCENPNEMRPRTLPPIVLPPIKQDPYLRFLVSLQNESRNLVIKEHGLDNAENPSLRMVMSSSMKKLLLDKTSAEREQWALSICDVLYLKGYLAEKIGLKSMMELPSSTIQKLDKSVHGNLKNLILEKFKKNEGGWDELGPEGRTAFNRIPESVQSRIAFAHSRCIDQVNWESVIPQTTPKNGITEMGASSVISMPVWGGYKLIRMVTKAFKSVRDFPSHKIACVHNDHKASSLDYDRRPITALLDELAVNAQTKGGLDPRKSACLALCMSNSMLDYHLDKSAVHSSVFGDVEKSLSKDTGICWDYTKVARHLSNTLNLKSRTRSNFPHSFVQYNFDGKWYGGETLDEITPQNCQFVDYRSKEASKPSGIRKILR
jgi:hypothetical protein